MLYICHILGLLALALGAAIPGSHLLKDVAPPVWPLSVEPYVVGADSPSHGRKTSAIRSATPFELVDGPVALGATLPIRKRLSVQSSVNRIAPQPASNTSPSPVSSLNQPSHWGPSDISNVLFGCITSILGVVAVLVTYYLHRRHSQRNQSDEPVELDDTSTLGTQFTIETQPLQDLTPSDTPINGALAGLNQDGTQSSVTLGAAN